MTEIERPFDLLDGLKGETIRITRKDGSTVTGTLKAFDQHINMGLLDATISYDERPEDSYQTDQYFQRGDTVVGVEPYEIPKKTGEP